MSLRIVHFIDAQGGGAVTRIITQAINMPKDKAEIFIVFFTPGPVHELAEKLGISTFVVQKSSRFHMIRQLARYLKEKKIDIIHTHTINGNFFGRIAGKVAGVKIVTTVHSYMLDELSGLESGTAKSLLLFQIDKLMSGMSDKFIAVTDGIKKRLLTQGIKKSITVIPPGVNMPVDNPDINPLVLKKNLGIDETDIVIGIVGRMVPVKNHKIFILAAEKLLKSHTNITFLLAGEGMLKDELTAMCRKAGIENKVIFTGWRNDMENIYPAIDIFVLCSSTEGQPLTILEAMSYSKAVVATDVEETAKTVRHEQTGILVKAGNTDTLAEGINKLILNPELRKKLGKAGKKLVEEEFSVNAMINKIVQVYI